MHGDVHELWGASGCPFLKLQYRPAVYEPPDSVKDVADYRDGDGPRGQLRTPSNLPAGVLEDLAWSLRQRDADAFSKAMSKLEGYDQASDEYDERVKAFMRGLQDVLLDPNLMAEGGASFVLEAVETKLKEQKKQVMPYSLKLKPNAGRKKDMFRSSDNPMMDATFSVLQPPSSKDAWECQATMGIHPGVLFGAHCAAHLSHQLPEVTFGGIWEEPDFMLEGKLFEERYPNAAMESLRSA